MVCGTSEEYKPLRVSKGFIFVCVCVRARARACAHALANANTLQDPL